MKDKLELNMYVRTKDGLSIVTHEQMEQMAYKVGE